MKTAIKALKATGFIFLGFTLGVMSNPTVDTSATGTAGKEQQAQVSTQAQPQTKKQEASVLEKCDKLDIGMSRSEVLGIMGTPDTESQTQSEYFGNTENLLFGNIFTEVCNVSLVEGKLTNIQKLN